MRAIRYICKGCKKAQCTGRDRVLNHSRERQALLGHLFFCLTAGERGEISLAAGKGVAVAAKRDRRDISSCAATGAGGPAGGRLPPPGRSV
jgi:hypothetical protein